MDWKPRDALAAVLVLAFCGVVGGLMFFKMPDVNKELFAALAGALGTLLTMVAKYYYPGDSASDTKNDTIASQAKALAAQPDVKP